MSNNKTALITGATSGLGLAYAKYFAKQGYDLLITGRRKEVIEKQAEDIRKEFNVNVTVKIVELGAKEGLDSLIETVKEVEKNSDIEVLVNNAGFGLTPYFYNLTREQIESMIFLHTNVTSILCNMLLKEMVARNSGIIINVSSESAFSIMKCNVLYSATKTFLLSLTRGIQMEIHNTNVKVQVVCPGMIDTNFHASAHMKVDKNAKGLFKVNTPETIVEASIRDLKKGKTICIPTSDGKIVNFLTRIMSRKAFDNTCIKIYEDKME